MSKIMQQPVRICFERIIPPELDAERAVRKALGQYMAANASTTLNPNEIAHVSRMAVSISKQWRQKTLKCQFLDGSQTMQGKVEALAHEWEKYANIKFEFVTSGTAEIRISFYADQGSWSAVGRDALNRQYFPLYQPTMNYGWLRDDTDDEEYSRVVLHEFGHALGCIHEHSSPNFTRKWNEEAVMNYFQGPPNYWKPEDIRYNVLSKYTPEGLAATKYDPNSIMLYAFDGALFSDNLGPTNSNTKPSKTDIEMIGKLYA